MVAVGIYQYMKQHKKSIVFFRSLGSRAHIFSLCIDKGKVTKYLKIKTEKHKNLSFY